MRTGRADFSFTGFVAGLFLWGPGWALIMAKLTAEKAFWKASRQV
jgi:hypothetical protein